MLNMGPQTVFNQLIQACKDGDLITVNSLLEIEAVRKTVAAQNNAAFLYAVLQGHLSVVNRLLEFKDVRENLTVHYNSAFRGAINNSHFDVAIRLLDFNTVREHASLDDNSALRDALTERHFPLAAKLLKIPSVASYAKLNQQYLVQARKAFFKSVEKDNVDNIIKINDLSRLVGEPYIENHILAFAFHDELCGNKEHTILKEGNAEGLIACPVINQFRRDAIAVKDRAKAKAGTSDNKRTRIEDSANAQTPSNKDNDDDKAIMKRNKTN